MDLARWERDIEEMDTPWSRFRCLTRAFVAGGAEGTRTPDPHTASVVRYQLRHGPAAHLAVGTRDILHTSWG
jgi:hypothetical protein